MRQQPFDHLDAIRCYCCCSNCLTTTHVDGALHQLQCLNNYRLVHLCNDLLAASIYICHSDELNKNLCRKKSTVVCGGHIHLDASNCSPSLCCWLCNAHIIVASTTQSCNKPIVKSNVPFRCFQSYSRHYGLTRIHIHG